MRRVLKVAVVIGGLAATGAIAGAFAGCAALFLGLVASPGLFGVHEPSGYAVAAMMGAALGAIAAPLFGWLVLRFVPLGRAIAWTMVGTVIGGATGWASHRIEPTLAAIVGFLIACALARLRSPRQLPNDQNPTRNAV